MGLRSAFRRALGPLKNFFLSGLPAGATLSYSQAGEDRILRFLFDSLQVPRPTYVDIGAHHPRQGNSTYLFYSTGSWGVCVEPNAEFAAAIRAERPRDLVIEAGILPIAGQKLMYYMFQEPTFNTFSPEEAEIRIRHGGPGGSVLKIVEVATLTLDQLLLRHFPQGVDLLSIDVEGLDESLLRHSNLPVRPKLIMVETVPFSNRHPVVKRMEIVQLMNERRYQVVADTYINTIYVDESLLSVAEGSAPPPRI